jgi:hypothetical protein
MKFQMVLSLIAIVIIFGSAFASTASPLLEDQLAVIESEMEARQPSFPILIKLFFTLKYFYKRFDCFESSCHHGSESDSDEELAYLSRLRFVLLTFHSWVVNFYTNSPLESLKAVRIYGNFEFAYLFSRYIVIRSKPSNLPVLQAPFYNILHYKEMTEKFKKRKFNILENYERIAKDIHKEPFSTLSRPLLELTKDSEMTTQNGLFDAVIEWEERKKILEEIILSIRSLNKFARHLTADMSGFLIRVKSKTKKFEFVLKHFQVDSQGPSLSHFISLFYQIQNQVQNVKFYYDLPLTTRNLITLFKIYWHQLIQNQMTDPFLFPRKMLALVSQTNNRWHERLFNFFKFSTIKLTKKSVYSLQNDDIHVILFEEKRKEAISELYRLKVNSEDNILDLDRGLWSNLLLHKDILTPYNEWIVKTYLILQYEKTKLGSRLQTKVCKIRNKKYVNGNHLSFFPNE